MENIKLRDVIKGRIQKLTERKFNIGNKVEHTMGVDTGRVGTVVSWDKIKTDRRSVPDLGKGHYHPIDRSKDIAVEREDGGGYDVWMKTFIKKVLDDGVLTEEEERNIENDIEKLIKMPTDDLAVRLSISYRSANKIQQLLKK